MAKRQRVTPVIAQKIKELESAGYSVRPKRNYTRHTFEVDKDVMAEFFELHTSLGVLRKDAVTDAFELWIDKHKADT